MTDVELSDAVAVVTGGHSGIGESAAVALADAGASVVIGDVADASGVVETIEDAGGEATAVDCDVTDRDEVAAMVETAVDTYGGLDVAFNNAGIEGENSTTGGYDPETFRQVVDVNLFGVWNCMDAEIDAMLEDGGGSIVNNASILGHVGFAEAAPYVAAKHGVLGLTKTAAQEYATEDVRVNAVCPGFVETPMLDRGGITDDPEMRQQIAALHPMNRLGEPREIADAVVWLSSEQASFVTGESLAVDGGYLSR